jgi:hypothetical protein
MPAEKKVINSAVRVDEAVDRGEGKPPGHVSHTFGPGQEEEFAKVASKEQIQLLTDQGAIAGFGAKPSEGSPAELGEVTIFSPDQATQEANAAAEAAGAAAKPAGKAEAGTKSK